MDESIEQVRNGAAQAADAAMTDLHKDEKVKEKIQMLLSSGVTNGQVIIGWAVIIVLVVIFVLVQKKINLKKAATGEDKARIESILKPLLQDAQGDYHMAYACWQETEHEIGKTTTKYWIYAIAFSWDGMFFVPLNYENKELRYKDTYYIAKNDLGAINAKKGESWMTLYDKSRKKIVSLEVKAENTKGDRFHPVNIVQKEEADAFARLAENWLNEVNDANGVSVTGKRGDMPKTRK